MKIQRLLFILGFLFFSLNINAQWSFGLKAGINKTAYSNGTSFYLNNGKTQLKNMSTSAMLYFNASKHFSFGIEPGMVQRGADDPFEYECFIFCGTGSPITTFPYNNSTVYMDYIQLPFFTKYKFHILNNKLELSAKGGYGISYATSGYQQSEQLVRTEKTDIQNIDFKNDGFNRWDSGIYGGLGMGLHFPFGTVILESELYYGLNSITDYALTNQSIGYSLGYRLDF